MKHIKLTVLFALLFLSFSTSAKVVNESRALQVAAQLFGAATRAVSQPRMKVIATSRTLNLAHTRAALQDNPAFYVITPQSGQGFVIVSGDDAAYPFVGYSTTSTFRLTNLPCNLRYWLELKREEILSVRKHHLSPTPEITQAWQNPSLLQTRASQSYQTAQWNQSPYENTQCPTVGDQHCVTGCTATAISIVMKCHKYPETGIGITEAYTAPSGIYVPERNLSQHRYNWDGMPMSFQSEPTEGEVFHVAQLMADVGAAIQANYGLEETSASYNIPKLIRHFGIDTETEYVTRNGFTDDQWTQKLRNELDDNGPILYYGNGDHGAHAFVLDGYGAYNSFSINWGWGGASNGTYYLGQFNPYESMDFNADQGAVFGFTAGQIDLSTPRLILHEFYSDGNYDGPYVHLDYKIESTFDDYKGIDMYVSLYGKDGNFKKECYRLSTYLSAYSKQESYVEFFYPDELLEVGDYYTLTYRFFEESDKMRNDFYTRNNKEIHAIAYDPLTIDESTQIKFNKNTREITVTSKRMTEIEIFDNQTGRDLSGGISSLTIDTRGRNVQDYKIVLTKRKERKEVVVSVK